MTEEMTEKKIQNNLIDTAFRPEETRIPGDQRRFLHLMTHIVAGYPDLETSGRLVEVMVESGVDMVEIQIPFSDPLADGPTIATANQTALGNGITPEHCFRLAKRLADKMEQKRLQTDKQPVPLLLMTYGNIPYSMGMENFARRAAESGISGLIVPDLPFDDSPDYREAALSYGLYPIPVVSPGMSRERLQQVVRMAGGFIYTTLRVGITGARKQIEAGGLEFLETIRKYSSLPVAAGFGISSPEMATQLEGHADAAVIGSHIINVYNTSGIDAVGQFIRRCKNHRGHHPEEPSI
jgi:tryptophan synthase alpha chain